MIKKRIFDKYKTERDLFLGKSKIGTLVMKMPNMWYPLLSCFIVIFISGKWLEYSPILFSVMIFCFLALNVCFFITQLKKYTSILDIGALILCFASLSIVDLVEGKSSSYISIWSMAFPYFGLMINREESISYRIRKWLIFFVVLIFVGIFVYAHDNPNIGSSIPLLFLGLLLNMVSFIRINEREIKEKEKELEQLKQAQTQAKLSSLKDQLSPHFLFNTLNTITSISQEQTVKDFVDEVANIYRYVLQFKEVDSVTLRQEMEFIQSYLYIIKSRLEGGIDFEINIENESLLDSKMPPLTLQMLIENAVKHNTTSADNPLSIKLFTTNDSMLVVQNVYQPKLSVLPGNETGLKNIAERYRLLYKKEIVVENKNGFFTVKLPIVMA